MQNRYSDIGALEKFVCKIKKKKGSYAKIDNKFYTFWYECF